MCLEASHNPQRYVECRNGLQGQLRARLQDGAFVLPDVRLWERSEALPKSLGIQLALKRDQKGADLEPNVRGEGV